MKCPVCGARFRGSRLCSRCGASLEPLMRALAEAYRLRQSARAALEQGDVRAAGERAALAERLHSTPAGAAIVRIASILD